MSPVSRRLRSSTRETRRGLLDHHPASGSIETDRRSGSGSAHSTPLPPAAMSRPRQCQVRRQRVPDSGERAATGRSWHGSRPGTVLAQVCVEEAAQVWVEAGALAWEGAEGPVLETAWAASSAWEGAKAPARERGRRRHSSGTLERPRPWHGRGGYRLRRMRMLRRQRPELAATRLLYR